MKLGVWAGVGLMILGCGGLATRFATINGRVTDLDGRPVRDARVFTIDGETRTTTTGAFSLRNNREDFLAVRAEIVQGGVTFRGRTTVRSRSDEAQQSVNIVVAPTSQLANLRGTVRDRFGNPLRGARVFAFTPGYSSSAWSDTDVDGRYELLELVAGRTYTVQAGGRNFGNDTDSVTLSPLENRTFNFTLAERGTPALPAPTGLTSITWVAPPRAFGRGASVNWDAIKRMIDPARAPRTSRLSADGGPIEVELRWNRQQGDDFYGYNIYRGLGLGTISEYDFYREPLAGTYIDGDRGLLPNTMYRYQLTSLGTGYPDFANSESARSAITEARTLNDLRAQVLSAPLRFTWNGNSGAGSFVVYIFDDFPGVGVASVWNNEGAQVSGTSLNYNEGTNPGGLVRGRTYYYLVLGLANGTASRTLSQVGSFVY